jgi:hypothetical protein
MFVIMCFLKDFEAIFLIVSLYPLPVGHMHAAQSNNCPSLHLQDKTLQGSTYLLVHVWRKYRVWAKSETYSTEYFKARPFFRDSDVQ